MSSLHSCKSVMVIVAVAQVGWAGMAFGQANETENFNTSPTDWVASGPVAIGFSNTNNTAGTSGAGEAGATFNRDTTRSLYGDVTLGGLLTDATPFSASGELFVGNPADPNGEVLLGYFEKDNGGTVFNAQGENEIGVSILEGDNEGEIRFRMQLYHAGNGEVRGDNIAVNYANIRGYNFSYDPGSRTLSGSLLGDGGAVLADRSLVVPGDVTFAVDTFGFTQGNHTSDADPARTIDSFVDGVTYARATAGDFNGSAALQPEDFDLLGTELQKPAADPDDRMFDVNDDGVITLADRDAILTASNKKLGDTDLDGDVDLNDLGNLASGFQQAGATWGRGDTDLDADVDLNDLGNLASNFAAGRAAAYAEFEALVPEPTALSLLTIAAAGMLRRRRI